jgi:3-dehydroquinate dehydratase II
MKILLIHGPNLNLLGKREPEFYGRTTIEEINSILINEAQSLGTEIEFFQSNSEGEIVSKIQEAMETVDGIVINPAAYTHTSIAIRDAIASTGLPTVEVHISNVYKRDDFRKKSFISGVAVGVISGFGVDSYLLGLRGLVDYLRRKFNPDLNPPPYLGGGDVFYSSTYWGRKRYLCPRSYVSQSSTLMEKEKSIKFPPH